MPHETGGDQKSSHPVQRLLGWESGSSELACHLRNGFPGEVPEPLRVKWPGLAFIVGVGGFDPKGGKPFPRDLRVCRSETSAEPVGRFRHVLHMVLDVTPNCVIGRIEEGGTAFGHLKSDRRCVAADLSHEPELSISVLLHRGTASATVWGRMNQWRPSSSTRSTLRCRSFSKSSRIPTNSSVDTFRSHSTIRSMSLVRVASRRRTEPKTRRRRAPYLRARRKMAGR